MANEIIFPTGFEVAKHSSGDMIKLGFSDDQGREFAVAISKESLPLLIAELQRNAPAPLPSMSPQFLQPGQTFSLKGTGIQKQPNGDLKLSLHVEVSTGRGVSLPITLKPNDCDALVSQLLANSTKN